MDAAVFNPSSFITTCNKRSYPGVYTRQLGKPIKLSANNLRYSCGVASNFVLPYNSRCNFRNGICLSVKGGKGEFQNAEDSCLKIPFMHFLLKKGVILVGVICGFFLIGCRRVFAVEGVLNGGYGVLEQGLVLLRSYWPTVLLVLRMFKEQGLILAALLSLSAFFSMAETSITTLWPWKVRELAEKESDNEGVFKMLRSDVTRFLTTILIGTTYCSFDRCQYCSYSISY